MKTITYLCIRLSAILVSCLAQSPDNDCRKFIKECMRVHGMSWPDENRMCETLPPTIKCLTEPAESEIRQKCAGLIGRFLIISSAFEYQYCNLEDSWLQHCPPVVTSCFRMFAPQVGESLKKYGEFDLGIPFSEGNGKSNLEGSEGWVCRRLSHLDNCVTLTGGMRCAYPSQLFIEAFYESLNTPPFFYKLHYDTCNPIAVQCGHPPRITAGDDRLQKCNSVRNVVSCMVHNPKTWACNGPLVYLFSQYVAKYGCSLGHELTAQCGNSDQVGKCVDAFYANETVSPCTRVHNIMDCIKPYYMSCEWFVWDRLHSVIKMVNDKFNCLTTAAPFTVTAPMETTTESYLTSTNKGLGNMCSAAYRMCRSKINEDLTMCKGQEELFSCLMHYYPGCNETIVYFLIASPACRLPEEVTKQCNVSLPYDCLSKHYNEVSAAYKKYDQTSLCGVAKKLNKCVQESLYSCPHGVQTFFGSLREFVMGARCRETLLESCMDDTGYRRENGTMWNEGCKRCRCEVGYKVCHSAAYCAGDHSCHYNGGVVRNGQKWRNDCNQCICLRGMVKCTNYSCPKPMTMLRNDSCHQWHLDCLRKVYPQGWHEDIYKANSDQYCSSLSQMFQCMFPTSGNKKYGCPHLTQYLLNMTDMCNYGYLVEEHECPKVASCLIDHLDETANYIQNDDVFGVCGQVAQLDACVLKTHDECEQGGGWLVKSFLKHIHRKYKCGDHLACIQGYRMEMANNMSMCMCKEGWLGVRCDVHIYPCSWRPCGEGGVCSERLTNYGKTFSCQCKQGHYGHRCHVNDSCQTSTCLNGGTCHPTPLMQPGYMCQCPMNTVGDRCHSKPACSITCNHGHCYRRGEKEMERCMCDKGWTGETCDTDIDECYKDPCGPLAEECVNLRGSYKCICRDGTEGMNCRPGCSVEKLKACHDLHYKQIMQQSSMSNDPCPAVKELRDCAQEHMSRCVEENEYTRYFRRSLSIFNHLPFSCDIHLPGDDMICDKKGIAECRSDYGDAIQMAMKEKNTAKACILGRYLSACARRYSYGCYGSEPFIKSIHEYLSVLQMKPYRCGMLVQRMRQCQFLKLRECQRTFMSRLHTAMYEMDHSTTCSVAQDFAHCVKRHLRGCKPTVMNRRMNVVRMIMVAMAMMNQAPHYCDIDIPHNIRPRCNERAITRCTYDSIGYTLAVVETDHMMNHVGYTRGNNFTSTCMAVERYFHCVLPHIQSCPEKTKNPFYHVIKEYGEPIYNCSFLRMKDERMERTRWADTTYAYVSM